MPTFQATEKARQRVLRIRETAEAFRRERPKLDQGIAEEFRALAQLDILRVYGMKAFTAKGKKEVRRLIRRESQVGRAA